MAEIDDYNFELPRGLVAQFPLKTRSDARLLVVDRRADSLAHHHVRDLPNLLRPGDCLVLNDTRVLPARLVGRRADTGGRWEGLFLEADDRGLWRVLCRARRLRPQMLVVLRSAAGQDVIELELVARQPDASWIVRPLAEGATFELLDRAGHVPLPQYIRKGQMVDADRTSYQTVYAQRPGAIAAPTAGLHFTPQLLQTLAAAGVVTARVTLHVGAGTFRPVTAERLADHTMHGEWGEIDPAAVATINDSRGRGGRTIAVGSTALRVLETAAADGTLRPFAGVTNLFIRPPYAFRAVDALLTNFHLPRTTLLVLVRTFGGDDLLRRAYEEAVREEYRFFSYGDAMLIL